MYVLGISARKVEEVAGALGVSSMSKSQVSRLCKSLDSEVAAFRRQRFDGVRFAYLWLDAAPPNPEGAVEKLLLAGHDVGERAQRLGRVCRGVDVDVDAAAVVGESSLVAKSADDFLQRLDVAVAQDGADHLDLVVIGAAVLCPSSLFSSRRLESLITFQVRPSPSTTW